jgi:hypothetical protein
MSGAIPVFAIRFHDIHVDSFAVFFTFVYLFIYLFACNVFKDTVTMSCCIMSNSKMIVKCL